MALNCTCDSGLTFARLFLMAGVVLCGTSVRTLRGQNAEGFDTQTPQLTSDPVFVHWRSNNDVASCGFCHYNPGNDFVERKTDFSSLRETQTWLKHDSHALSAKRVEPIAPAEIEARRQQIGPTEPDNLWIGRSNAVSYKICENLGYDIASPAGWQAFRDNCLTCHAGYQQSSASVTQSSEGLSVPVSSFAPAAGSFASLATTPAGISCTYCHQLGRKADWIDSHGGLNSATNWRLLSPAAKEAQGMRHLADAAQQAQLCSACHIGDHAQGMFVTHAMYVAGHPPLPSFELQTFLDAMPVHWRDELEAFEKMEPWTDREAYFAQNYSVSEMADTHWDSRRMLIGALVASQHYLNLLAEADPLPRQRPANADGGSGASVSFAETGKSHWGDYALYDCSACHHELRVPSRRQSQYLESEHAPGRPRLLEWTNPMLDIWLEYSPNRSQLESERERLRAAAMTVPFGDRQACTTAAKELSQALAAEVSEISRLKIDRQVSSGLLEKLLKIDAHQVADYQSARQVQWAIQVLAKQLGDEQLLTDMRQLNDLVTTELPSARRGNLYTQFPPDRRQDAEEFMEQELQKMRRFDAEAFHAELSRLRPN